MARSEFERFEQRVSDELNKLKEIDRQRPIDSFVDLGSHYGIDVIAEVLEKGKFLWEVLAMIEEKKTKG